MSRSLVECVPNFSEGRDPAKLDAIVAAIASAGVSVLDRHMDSDHHRSVVTFAGPPEAVAEAAVRGVSQAVELIDLTTHRGVHPRMGAADVVPFIPLEGTTLAECARLAAGAGEEIWRRCGVPVYLYEAAARRPERRGLENIRRAQFEGLREEVPRNPERAPDIGAARLHPTAGATAVGARKILIAFNINLATGDIEVARRIAHAVRASSGGLPCVKAMGVMLSSRGQAQVSMNLTDYEITSPIRVFDEVARLAAQAGVEIAGSEFVGLVPEKALTGISPAELGCENFHDGIILEARLGNPLAQG